MEIRVAICEKDARSREYLIANMKELPQHIQVLEYDNVLALEEEIENNTDAFDIICMSTMMVEEGDGMEAAKRIRRHCMKVTIFIISDTDMYYRDAFEIFAMTYLVKPVQYHMLENCFRFYTKNHNTERRVSWMLKSKGGKWKRIFWRDIWYIESRNREYILHMSDGETIESYGKLDELVEQITSDSLVRCHQSYIVNMFYSNEMCAHSFVIGGREIPISRKFQKTVKEQYYNFMFGRM